MLPTFRVPTTAPTRRAATLSICLLTLALVACGDPGPRTVVATGRASSPGSAAPASSTAGPAGTSPTVEPAADSAADSGAGPPAATDPAADAPVVAAGPPPPGGAPVPAAAGSAGRAPAPPAPGAAGSGGPTVVPPRPEPGFAAPPPEGPRPPAGSPAAPLVPGRTATVSGPTLDNLYPEVWGHFNRLSRQCAHLSNGGNGVVGEVTLLDIAVVDQQPARPRAFEAAGPLPDDRECVESANSAGGTATTACRPGFVLPAGGVQCLVGIEAFGEDGTDWTATLRYRFTTRCTSAVGVCGKVDPPPSAADPVTVTITQTMPLVACFVDHQPTGPSETSCPARSTTP